VPFGYLEFSRVIGETMPTHMRAGAGGQSSGPGVSSVLFEPGYTGLVLQAGLDPLRYPTVLVWNEKLPSKRFPGAL